MNENKQDKSTNHQDTPKRKREQASPPDLHSRKEAKKNKPEIMEQGSPVTLEDIMASINSTKDSVVKNSNVLGELKTSLANLQSEVTKIDETLISIRNDLALTKQDVVEIKQRLDNTDEIQVKQAVINEEVTASINKLLQLSKASELSIHNLPTEFEKSYIISNFATWSGLKLNDDSFKHSSLVTSKKGTSTTLYLDFCNESLKLQLMKIVKSCQRDINKKYIPLLCENIFELPMNCKSRGVELQFRNSMTNVNREIFNEARKFKLLFCAVWLNQGNILVKEKEGSKPIRILSMNDLKTKIAGIKTKDHKK
ncbi:hypothetical protein ACKWTF_012194 [Chironomus riparius]